MCVLKCFSLFVSKLSIFFISVCIDFICAHTVRFHVCDSYRVVEKFICVRMLSITLISVLQSMYLTYFGTISIPPAAGRRLWAELCAAEGSVWHVGCVGIASPHVCGFADHRSRGQSHSPQQKCDRHQSGSTWRSGLTHVGGEYLCLNSPLH